MSQAPIDTRQLSFGKLDAFGSIEKAIDHTRFMLFNPFDVGKWFAVGLIIFLHMLGTGGSGSVPTNFNTGPMPGGGGGQDLQEMVADVRAFIDENMATILMVAAIGFVVIGGVTVLLVWLGSRGRLMFVRAVALNDASIGDAWRDAGRVSASLFWFTIAFIAITWIILFMAAALAITLFVSAVDQGASQFSDYSLAVFIPLLIFLFYLLVAIPIGLLLNDFAVPLMHHFQIGVLDALGLSFRIAMQNIIPVTLFYVIRFVVFIMKGIATMIAGCLTCFVGFLPILSQTLTAPVHVFDRAFSMYALESLGPEFMMIRPTEVEADPFDDGGQRDLTRY